jgi:hypothetical protein
MEIVNGYVCQTCCDADLAVRNIDPAHPKDGPFGQDKVLDPSDPKTAAKARAAHGPAVRLDGALKTDPAAKTDDPAQRPPTTSGVRLDLTA